MIDTINLRKSFKLGKTEIPVVKGIDLKVKEGEMIALLGPSGCGKSTFLNILGGLLPVTSGEVYIGGEPLHKMNENQLCLFRRKKLGFVFQSYNLIPTMTALENVALTLTFSGVKREEREQRAETALTLVGLGDRIHHKPQEMSGGQQQRVSIARALINDPDLILADEPTGNLDTKTSTDIMNIIEDLSATSSKPFVIVTHDPEAAEYCSRTIHMRDGIIENIS